MVERLGRKVFRPIQARGDAALVCDPAHGLHQAVEPSALAPGADVAVGAQGDDDDARPEPRQLLGGQTARGQRARAIRLADDVARPDEGPQPLGVIRQAQIEARRALAETPVHDVHLDARQVLGGDQEHVRAVRGERASTDRARDDPGQIHDAHAGQRAVAAPRRLSRSVADAHDLEKRQRGHRVRLRVVLPFVGSAHHSRAQARGCERVFELRRLPARHRGRDGIARSVAPEHAERAVAMMGKVAVELDPTAVSGSIEAGDGMPRTRRRAAIHTEIALTAERGRGGPRVDGDRLSPSGAEPPELGGRQPRRGDTRRRRGRDLEVAREHGIAARELRPLESGGILPGRAPEVGKDGERFGLGPQCYP